MQRILEKGVILNSYPKHHTVTKKTSDEKIRVSCEINPSFYSSYKEIIVEAWTDIKGGKFQAYPLRKKAGTHTFYKDFPLNDTGMYKITFRCRKKDHLYWTWLGSNNHKDYAEIHVDPAYIKSSITYNAFIRFFGHKKINKDGKISFGDSGSFDDLKKRLDEIKSLGVNILYLNPIHLIGELYRNYNPHDQFPNYLQPGCPYSIKDYKSVDPELGIDKDNSLGPHASLSDPMKEFKSMVDEAHARGIKVYMDLVFNHTSHDFILQRLHPEWFLYKEDIKNHDLPYLYPSDIKKNKPWGDPAHTYCPFDHGYWWEDAAQLNWEYKLDPGPNEPPKNPTLKEMYTYFKSIPKYWIKHLGIDGFRCDVAYRVPIKFWNECIIETREFAKKEHKNNPSLTGDVVFIAESYCDDLQELLEAGFSAVYGDYGNKLYSPLTLKGYLDYMYNLSGKYFPENSQFFIFPECHDFHRLPTKIGTTLDPEKEISERINKSRWTITATLPGMPMIFNGFEKLEWQPVNLFSYSSIDWESDKDLKEYITKVNKIRHRYEALQKGTYQYIHTNQGINEATQIFAFARKYNQELIILATNMDVNNSAGPTILYLDSNLGIDYSQEYILEDVLNNQTYIRSGQELIVILGPGESHIFVVKKFKINNKQKNIKQKKLSHF